MTGHAANACSKRRMETRVLSGKSSVDLNRLVLPRKQNSKFSCMCLKRMGIMVVVVVPGGK